MSRVVAVDCGTMFFQTAEEIDGEYNIKTIRNAFVELNDDDDSGDTENILKQNGWNHIKHDNKYYVIGEDALRVAKMLPGKLELRRPLQGGVLNKGEDMKMIILTELIRQTIGEGEPGDVVCTCVSSESVDESIDNKFHKGRLMGIFKSLGWDVYVIEEGYAVILSENPTAEEDGEEIKYTGIGASFGGGRTNCVLSRNAVKITGMSVSMGGDYIDSNVSEQTGASISQVVSRKEKKLDFNNLDYDNDIIFALDVYYTSLIENAFKNFARKFNKEEGEFDYPLKIIIAGGTSMPNGFCDKVKEVLSKLKLPFEVEDVIHAKDPRNAVVKGCLRYAQIQNSKNKNKNKKPKEELSDKDIFG